MKEQLVGAGEAPRMHHDLRAQQSLAIHWGTFELSDEPLDEPPRAKARARTKAGVREDDFFLLVLRPTRKSHGAAPHNKGLTGTLPATTVST